MPHNENRLVDWIINYFREDLSTIKETDAYQNWSAFMETPYSYKLRIDGEGSHEAHLAELLRDELQDLLMEFIDGTLQEELSVGKTYEVMEEIIVNDD